jgi:hypothetical protein
MGTIPSIAVQSVGGPSEQLQKKDTPMSMTDLAVADLNQHGQSND